LLVFKLELGTVAGFCLWQLDKFSHVKFTKPGLIADILQIELAAGGISELRGKESPRKETNQAYDPLCDILVKYLGNY